MSGPKARIAGSTDQLKTLPTYLFVNISRWCRREAMMMNAKEWLLLLMLRNGLWHQRTTVSDGLTLGRDCSDAVLQLKNSAMRSTDVVATTNVVCTVNCGFIGPRSVPHGLGHPVHSVLPRAMTDGCSLNDSVPQMASAPIAPSWLTHCDRNLRFLWI